MQLLVTRSRSARRFFAFSVLLAFSELAPRFLARRQWKARPDTLAGAADAAAEDDDAQISARMLRLMDAQIDRFLTGLAGEDSERATRMPSGLDNAAFEERSNTQARALVKRISKNLRPLSKTLWKLESTLKAQDKAEGQREAEIDRLEREISELKDTATQNRQLTELRTHNKQLATDKEAMVKTVQQLLRQSSGGKVNGTIYEVKAGEQRREEQLQNAYQKRIEDLRTQADIAFAHQKKLAEQLKQATQSNREAKNMLGIMNATSENLWKDKESLQRALDQVQEQNADLVRDKSQLMRTLRSLLTKNSALRKKALAAHQALGASPASDGSFVNSHPLPRRKSLLSNPEASDVVARTAEVRTSDDPPRMFLDATKALDLRDDS